MNHESCCAQRAGPSDYGSVHATAIHAENRSQVPKWTGVKSEKKRKLCASDFAGLEQSTSITSKPNIVWVLVRQGSLWGESVFQMKLCLRRHRSCDLDRSNLQAASVPLKLTVLATWETCSMRKPKSVGADWSIFPGTVGTLILIQSYVAYGTR